MRFKHYDSLRTFTIVARLGKISLAAEELSLTKGAISHQIKTLEQQLGFDLFHRQPRGMVLTRKGRQILEVTRTAFASVDRQIDALREAGQTRAVTLGVSTYLASRWLSPLLMTFIQAHPQIRLRVQPMIDLFDLERDGIDVAIRWGRGDWSDMVIEPLFDCPAFPVAAPFLARKVEALGLAEAIQQTPLLNDREGSTAWAEWFDLVGLPFNNDAAALTIPDPNVRVQAVIDGQGAALNDRLVGPEIEAGKLCPISDHQLSAYGYHLAYPPCTAEDPVAKALIDWLHEQAGG
ncbi:MAG: LysR substrate-binding domain-containing protein [Pseudomonadota bacterium]